MGYGIYLNKRLVEDHGEDRIGALWAFNELVREKAEQHPDLILTVAEEEGSIEELQMVADRHFRGGSTVYAHLNREIEEVQGATPVRRRAPGASFAIAIVRTESLANVTVRPFDPPEPPVRPTPPQ